MTSPFDWGVLQQAAVAWQAEHGDHRPSFLYLPVKTDEAIIEMASEIYGVFVKHWPVESPYFGDSPPFEQRVPDRDVESTLAVLAGEQNNTRGLPFPLIDVDTRQRDWQFEFVHPDEARLRERVIFDRAQDTLQQLMLWAFVQVCSPQLSDDDLVHRWIDITGYTDHLYLHHYVEQIRIEERRMRAKRNQNMEPVGTLWIVTNNEATARNLIPHRIAQILRPRLFTPSTGARSRGQTFGSDDRIFYSHWNPDVMLPMMAANQVPDDLLPIHQLDPLAVCDCVICKSGVFTEHNWWVLQQRAHQSGRLSQRDPSEQSIPRSFGSVQDRTKFLADSGVIDLGEIANINDLDAYTYDKLRQMIIHQPLFMEKPNFLNITES